MKRKARYILISIIVVFEVTLMGCAAKNMEQENKLVSTANADLIYTETISPNKDYAASEEDIVKYTVEIYQNKDNEIIVNADSTSGFFQETQYILEYGKSISEQDISIEWTTFMGNPEATEEDQLCVANVSISENEKVFSERKINFVNRAIDIVTDVIDQNK